MAIDEQGKPKDPNQRTPFVWLYEILDETVIRDEFDPWGRNSKPQLFFMDESSLADWTSAQHKTNVLEPMRQMVELFFEKINDFQGDKYKEVLNSSQIGRANWGKFITDLGSVKKFFNEDLSGHQVGFDFTMSKTDCDTRTENVIVCNLVVQVDTVAETSEGANDGTATANHTGEQVTGEVSYLWDDPLSQVTKTATLLAPNTYSVTVTDLNLVSCTDEGSGTVNPGVGELFAAEFNELNHLSSSDPSFEIGNESFSMDCWVKATDVNPYHIMGRMGASGDFAYGMTISTSGVTSFISNNGTSLSTSTASLSITSGVIII
jgi:hypothetical protein